MSGRDIGCAVEIGEADVRGVGCGCDDRGWGDDGVGGDGR